MKQVGICINEFEWWFGEKMIYVSCARSVGFSWVIKSTSASGIILYFQKYTLHHA